MKEYQYLSIITTLAGNELLCDTENELYSVDQHLLCILTQKEYKRVTGDDLGLTGHQVTAYHQGGKLPREFVLFGTTYEQTRMLSSFPAISDYRAYLVCVDYLVVANEEEMEKIYQGQKDAFLGNASKKRYIIQVDMNGSFEEKVECYQAISAELSEQDWLYVESKQQNSNQFYALYGGFLFLGIFLGAMFVMATVLIIYYKQISEGYEDKNRFEIMQKVGMSRHEVKKSIHSQVLMVFFLPLITACVHVTAAFPMINKLLILLNFTNNRLFVLCTVKTVVIFGIIYSVVYSVTAKVYYRIVN